VLYDDGRSIRYEYDSRGNPTRILRGGRPFTLDVDDDGAAGALSDGLLVLRYLHGFSGPALVAGAAGVNAQNADAAGVAAFLAAALGGPLDVDGDGSDEAATDGRLVLRYLFGFRGAALVDAALGDDAQRDTATAVVDHLEALLP
jgi:hypothetical protein